MLERAQYSCEIAGCEIGDRRGVDYSLHHRRPRQMGGSRWPGINLASNLLVACGSGVSGCHGAIESRRADAVGGGWLVVGNKDPALVSVLICGERWCYLTNDGQYSDDPPERV